jgi:hypothetical protein
VKNFPHQYSDFAKLRQTLETIRDLNDEGDDVGDDGVLGYELARHEIYTFRGPDLPLAQRIVLEQTKPRGSQGPRTAAREMRRTLLYLGWLAANWELTPRGLSLLDTAAGSEDERAEWQRALLDLAVGEGEDVSHPVRILLRLVDDHNIVERQGAELALEARDDSEQEYQRINMLLDLPEGERVRGMGTTSYQVANARKILPSFAEQANLIHRSSSAAPYALTEAGRAALGEGFTGRPVELRPAVRSLRRRRTAGAPRRLRVGDVAHRAPAEPEGWRSLSHEEQIAATRLRFERTARHQQLVSDLLALLSEDEVELFEDGSSYDLLRVPVVPAPLTIFEVKTLESDDLTQTRLAIGQLFSYEHLNVRPRWPDRDVRRAVVYERRIDEELAALLEAVDISAFALLEGELVPLNNLARADPLA